jgi:hypothetical protein
VTSSSGESASFLVGTLDINDARTGLNLLPFDFSLFQTLASSQMITKSLFVLPKFHIGPDWGRNSSKMKKLAK